jgi:hypothetical protein
MFRVQPTRVKFHPTLQHYFPSVPTVLDLVTEAKRKVPRRRPRPEFSCRAKRWKIYNFYVFIQMKNKRFWTEWWQALPEFNLVLISSWITFWFVTVVPKLFNCATFSKDILATFISWFWPAFWWRDRNIYFVFSAFTSGPTSLLASLTVSFSVCFSSWHLFLLIDSHRQHTPAADVYHLISVSLGFPGPC